jgi:hypothetical protein
MQVTFHWRHALFYITYFLLMLAFQASFCRFFIYNNKSQLLLHPYIPSHLINLKNQLRYRYWTCENCFVFVCYPASWLLRDHFNSKTCVLFVYHVKLETVEWEFTSIGITIEENNFLVNICKIFHSSSVKEIRNLNLQDIRSCERWGITGPN